MCGVFYEIRSNKIRGRVFVGLYSTPYCWRSPMHAPWGGGLAELEAEAEREAQEEEEEEQEEAGRRGDNCDCECD